MLYVWLTLLIILNAFWLILLCFALPGNWLIVISTALFAWWQGGTEVFSVYTLVFITILALLGEVIEFFAGIGGARKAGASWFGSIGALLGSLIGAIFGTFLIPIPLLGTVLGACGGAFAGVSIFEIMRGKQLNHSVRSGFGAGLGQLFGITAKFTLGVMIWLIVTVAAFWP